MPAVYPSNTPLDNNDVNVKYYYVFGFQGNAVSNAKAHPNYATYGVLYNWLGAKTACPAGWHNPSEEEWQTLEKFLGMSNAALDSIGVRNSGDVGGKLKETGTSHWTSPNNGATNAVGFNALPGEWRDIGGTYFQTIGVDAVFWTSTETSATYGYNRELWNQDSAVYRWNDIKSYGCSVRCVRDL